ncbi:MAG TPA: TonB-dependent receptor [Acidobacteriaceae bacterium]
MVPQIRWSIALACTWLLAGVAVWAQAPAAVAPSPPRVAPPPTATAATQGSQETIPDSIQALIRGTVKAGATPLPGVRVTATNTLSGARYSTTTGVDGAYRMAIPHKGRYVLRTEFAAFAPATREALVSETALEPTADFSLTLLSRVVAQPEDRGELAGRAGGGPGAGQRGGRGAAAQTLSLINAVSGALETGQGGSTGAQLPSLTGGGDFSSDSVAVSGASGSSSSFAGINLDEVRQRAESDPSLNPTGGQGGGPGGPGGSGGGGFGGFGGFGGGGRGGRGGFGRFNPNQPHGSFFWTGGNSALDARDFAIRGQAIGQPAYASNRFGIVFAGAPYLPHLIEHDKKDYLFFTLSGQRTSSPFDQYGTVPTAAERTGDFSQLTTQAGQPIVIYDPTTGQPFAQNTITGDRITPQAQALLSYVPLPNLSGRTENYERLTTAETNSTVVGLRLIHSFNSTGGSPLPGLLRQYMGTSQGLQQNIHANYNYTHSASDLLDILPALGGKQQTHQYSLELGYTLSRGRLTNNLTVNWNRTQSNTTNYFTGQTDVASQLGLNVFDGNPVSPLNYGLPNITLNQFTGLSEQEPTLQTNQTISLSESSSWTHGKHNVRWGADLRRVHLDLIGKANSTGTYYFTGLFTQQPGSSGLNGVGSTTNNGLPQTGSSLADLLLGLPQQTSIQAPYQKAYLRENVYDGYLQDDWRVLPSLTALAGVRYEYFSPYSEKNDRLATLDTGNDFSSVATVLPNSTGPYTGRYPRSLIYPERANVSPRLGFAWRAIKNTVVRGGYGINYANGQYAKFVQQFAFQPPFADVQTNEATQGAAITLANGFPHPQSTGNYAVNKNYRLPYVQVWNLDLQRTLPMNIVLNVGYNGSKGSRLDIVDAPGRSATASLSGDIYDYEDSVAFSRFNALAVRLRKRMQRGVAVGATYTYSHSIDNATSIGGTGYAVAQNWQDLLAEESNSSFDIRHQLRGDFVYELPLGADKTFFTRGFAAHALEGLSLSGNYAFATGAPLTPHYEASVTDVARGSAGSLRPDRVPGSSLSSGARSLDNWFNRDAFAQPAGVYGTASRNSIPGPGTLSFNAAASKTFSFTETRSLELRASANNVFNTVQYAGVDTTLGSGTYGQVISAAGMRQINFLARFRF